MEMCGGVKEFGPELEDPQIFPLWLASAVAEMQNPV